MMNSGTRNTEVRKEDAEAEYDNTLTQQSRRKGKKKPKKKNAIASRQCRPPKQEYTRRYFELHWEMSLFNSKINKTLFSKNNTPYLKAARASTDAVHMLRRANKIALLT